MSLSAGLILALSACSPEPVSLAKNQPKPLIPLANENPITPLPLTMPIAPEKVALGRHFFFDPRLSRNNTVSCAHCHAFEHYGADGRARSIGIDQQEGPFNAPTVFNSAFNFRQFWDGRAHTLEEQVDGPLHSTHEMNSSWPAVLAKLASDTALQTLSTQAYGRPLDAQVIRLALADFQRSLITPNAPFDRYLKGDTQAISPEAKEGWRLFRELGCISCHQGVNIGGNMFSRLGIMDDYFEGRTPRPADWGLFNQTGLEEDRFRFKVPSLRNVAKTAPYFHDGNVNTLEEAVELMVRLQLGMRINTYERDRIVAFLDTLTGTLPSEATP